MTTALPHSALVATHASEYVEAARKITDKALRPGSISDTFRGVFKTSVASYCVLERLAGKNEPFLHPAASTARRLPLLIGLRQVSLAHVELRRWIELIVWSLYFREHPVECRCLMSRPRGGFARDLELPIEYCAHREATFYLNYTKELFHPEPSKLTGKAASGLLGSYKMLSAYVHPADAATRGHRFAPPFETTDEATMQAFQRVQRSVLAAGCLLVAGWRRGTVDRLPAVERAWFDWLIGTSAKKKIRSGPFGLSVV